MIGKRGQASPMAGKVAEVAGKEVLSGGAKIAKTVGTEVTDTVTKGVALGTYTASQAANSLGQSKDALVDMGPSLFAFFLAVFAHTLSTGIIFPSNLFIASVLYTISFFLIAMSIIMRKSNPAKGRDLIIVVITFMIMGMVG